jgi:hypothetical protein
MDKSGGPDQPLPEGRPEDYQTPVSRPATAEDNVELISRKDALELLEKRRQNHISLISIVVTFCIAAFSVVWNAKLQSQATKTADALETTRVSNDEALSNFESRRLSSPLASVGILCEP